MYYISGYYIFGWDVATENVITENVINYFDIVNWVRNNKFETSVQHVYKLIVSFWRK